MYVTNDSTETWILRVQLLPTDPNRLFIARIEPGANGPAVEWKGARDVGVELLDENCTVIGTFLSQDGVTYAVPVSLVSKGMSSRGSSGERTGRPESTTRPTAASRCLLVGRTSRRVWTDVRAGGFGRPVSSGSRVARPDPVAEPPLAASQTEKDYPALYLSTETAG
jgi:hypothetical protein